MQQKQLDRIFKKDSWTGREVGKLLFSALLHDLKRYKNDDSKCALFDEREFNQMIHSLRYKQYQMNIYTTYKKMHDCIIDIFNMAQGLRAQFDNGYYQLFIDYMRFFEALKATKIPLIMTVEQYTALSRRAKRKKVHLVDALKDDDDKERIMQGIAIIKDYRDKEYKELFKFHSLHELLNREDELKEMHKKYKMMMHSSLSWIYAYNALLGVLGKHFSIKDLQKYACIETGESEDRLNQILRYEEKLSSFFSTGTELDADLLKPAKEDIEAVKAEIEELKHDKEAHDKMSTLDDYIERLQSFDERLYQ